MKVLCILKLGKIDILFFDELAERKINDDV